MQNFKIQFKARDVGRSMYVHLFGVVFGLGVSKALNFNGLLINNKQSSVYHSDLFSFVGTLFLWVFYPSFNAIFAEDAGQSKAIINTYLAIAASTIVTVAMSSLVGNGKLNAVRSMRFFYLFYCFFRIHVYNSFLVTHSACNYCWWYSYWMCC